MNDHHLQDSKLVFVPHAGQPPDQEVNQDYYHHHPKQLEAQKGEIHSGMCPSRPKDMRHLILSNTSARGGVCNETYGGAHCY